MQDITNQVFVNRYQLYSLEGEQLEAEFRRFMNGIETDQDSDELPVWLRMCDHVGIFMRYWTVLALLVKGLGEAQQAVVGLFWGAMTYACATRNGRF